MYVFYIYIYMNVCITSGHANHEVLSQVLETIFSGTMLVSLCDDFPNLKTFGNFPCMSYHLSSLPPALASSSLNTWWPFLKSHIRVLLCFLFFKIYVFLFVNYGLIVILHCS